MKNDRPAARSDRQRRDGGADGSRRDDSPRGSRRAGGRDQGGRDEGARGSRRDDQRGRHPRRDGGRADQKNTSLYIGIGVLVGLILIVVLIVTSSKRDPQVPLYGTEPKPAQPETIAPTASAPVAETPSAPQTQMTPVEPQPAMPQPANIPKQPEPAAPAPSNEPPAPAKADWAKLDSLDKKQDLLKWENATSSGCAEGFLRHCSRSAEVKLIVQPLDGNKIRIYRKLEKVSDQPPTHCNLVHFFLPLQGAQFNASIGAGKGHRDQIINMDSEDTKKLPSHTGGAMSGDFKDIGGGIATLDVDLDKVIPGSGPFGIIRPFHVWIFFRSDTKSFLYDDQALQSGRLPFIDPRRYFLTSSNVATVEVK